MTSLHSFVRTIVSENHPDFTLLPTFTLAHQERSFSGIWNHPDVPLLVFRNNALPGPKATFHGGRLGSGWPVQLLLWGDWWLTPAGAARGALVIARTRAMIDSPYFSELSQYGISPPAWRGATVITEPGPPAGFTSDTGEQILDLVNDLVDDNVSPSPEDEPIAFVVLMPGGFSRKPGDPNGAHTYTAYYEFPFSKDYYWAAWVRSFDPANGDDPEDTARTISHEIVEMLSDPDTGAGWYAGPVETGEISDAGVEADGTKQAAWVNGAHVQSYWSNRHGATVIPIDRDYRARLVGTTKELARRTVDKGSFRPSVSDNALCGQSPACCINDRDYVWTVAGFDEKAHIRVMTERYRAPKSSWMLEGILINGTGSISLNLLVQGFLGREPVMNRQSITLQYDARDTVLELTALGTGLNFDVRVACNVRDTSIVGALTVDVISQPSVVIGFVGAEVALDADYLSQREACFR
jgi:hypothetical protein